MQSTLEKTRKPYTLPVPLQRHWYTVMQAAEQLQVNKRTIWRKIRSGELTVRKFGERGTAVSKASVDMLVANG